MKTLTPEKILEVTTFLSECKLSRVMTAVEITAAVKSLRDEHDQTEFEKIKEKILFNLESIKEGSEFYHALQFKSKEFKAYVVIAHEFMIHHPEYEFNDTYTRTRRRSKIILPPKKVVEEIEE